LIKYVEEGSILPTIVTTKKSWRKKFKEADRLGLRKIALFLTFLKKDERPELYSLLTKSKIEEIPFVHIRGDFDLKEMDFLAKEYGARIFNTHPGEPHPNIRRYYPKIFVENIFGFKKKEFNRYPGVCIDFSHLENDRRMYPKRYKLALEFINSHKIGCNHIGAIWKKMSFNKSADEYRCDSHFLKKLSDLDYLKNYPERYFSDYVAIELENNLITQLKIKEYILKMFS
jgi:hypothetical protein